MSECPYLKYKESKSCQACTGYVCLAYNREKKLSDVTECKGDYWECLRYIDIEGEPVETVTVTPTSYESYTLSTTEDTTIIEEEPPVIVEPIVETVPLKVYIKSPCGCGEDILLSKCPYQSTTIPVDKKSCTGVWCYANNKNVRVPKNCRNYQICTVYLMSKYKGVPFP